MYIVNPEQINFIYPAQSEYSDPKIYKFKTQGIIYDFLDFSLIDYHLIYGKVKDSSIINVLTIDDSYKRTIFIVK